LVTVRTELQFRGQDGHEESPAAHLTARPPHHRWRWQPPVSQNKDSMAPHRETHHHFRPRRALRT
jgi:hypothetical protein